VWDEKKILVYKLTFLVFKFMFGRGHSDNIGFVDELLSFSSKSII
jgi:hypothetical protein